VPVPGIAQALNWELTFGAGKGDAFHKVALANDKDQK
jgi:hypothetical protein